MRRPDGGRCEIYLKREDLNHTGAHKINNSLGQVLLCKRMGKQRIIAETGAGQHGVATVRAGCPRRLICSKLGSFGMDSSIGRRSNVRTPANA